MFLRNGVSESIAHEIKHVTFQFYRAHPYRVIWQKLTNDDKHMNFDFDEFDFLDIKRCLQTVLRRKNILT